MAGAAGAAAAGAGGAARTTGAGMGAGLGAGGVAIGAGGATCGAGAGSGAAATSITKPQSTATARPAGAKPACALEILRNIVPPLEKPSGITTMVADAEGRIYSAYGCDCEMALQRPRPTHRRARCDG
jgi:hypothetical protein